MMRPTFILTYLLGYDEVKLSIVMSYKKMMRPSSVSSFLIINDEFKFGLIILLKDMTISSLASSSTLVFLRCAGTVP